MNVIDSPASGHVVLKSLSDHQKNLLVMQRRGPVQYDEFEELLALFADEHALYPAVYGDRMGFFYGLAAP